MSEPGGSDADQNDETDLVAAWRAQLGAMDSGEVDLLRACFTVDMTLTHMTGYVQPLEEWLDGVGRRDFVYHRMIERSVEIVELSKAHALLVGKVTTGVTDDGSGRAWRLRMEQDYVRDDVTGWLCSASRVSLD